MRNIEKLKPLQMRYLHLGFSLEERASALTKGTHGLGFEGMRNWYK